MVKLFVTMLWFVHHFDGNLLSRVSFISSPEHFSESASSYDLGIDLILFVKIVSSKSAANRELAVELIENHFPDSSVIVLDCFEEIYRLRLHYLLAWCSFLSWDCLLLKTVKLLFADYSILIAIKG